MVGSRSVQIGHTPLKMKIILEASVAYREIGGLTGIGSKTESKWMCLVQSSHRYLS